MDVVKAPDNRLRVKTRPVKKITPALKSLITQMIKLTKTFQDPEGVGLASTQVDLDERFFVAKRGGKFVTCINPEITFRSKRTKKYFEGCLSIPNYFGETKRSLNIKVTYQNLNGKQVAESLKSLDAWIFQHEMDHLDGTLFPDKVLAEKGRFYKFSGKDKRGEDIFEEVTL